MLQLLSLQLFEGGVLNRPGGLFEGGDLNRPRGLFEESSGPVEVLRLLRLTSF